MRSSNFSVETRGQGAVILGGGPQLVASLKAEFLLQGVQAIAAQALDDIATLAKTHDLDYILVFDQVGEPDLLENLQARLENHESRLILLSHLGTQTTNFFGSPVYKHLIYSDYLGVGELVSDLLESWRKNLQTSKTILVQGDGLSELSLIGQNDLAHLIVLATLDPSRGDHPEIELGNPEPLSLLSLAYLLRSNLDFKISLKFDDSQPAPVLPFDPATYASVLNNYNFRLSESLENNLKSYLTHYNFSQRDLVPSTPPPIVERIVKKPIIPEQPSLAPVKKLTPLKIAQPTFVPQKGRGSRLSLRSFVRHPLRPRTILSKGLIIALALYLGTLAFSATIAGLTLKNFFHSINQGQLPKNTSLNNFSLTYLKANWLAITAFPGLSQKQSVQDVTLLLEAYSESLTALDSAHGLSSSVSELSHYVFGSGSADIASLVSLSRLQTEDLYQKLSLLDGALPSTPPSLIPTRYQDNYLQAKARLTEVKRTVITAKAILSTAPDLIGLGGRRKYGVLFQNNMELRATGGFIGSFGIMSFENGKLYDLAIFDVYDADGQLKGHVEPPAPIKNILGEANWYLRDSNFDPDFPTSARRAEWFIKKSINQDLDGIIAVNVNTLATLLAATGPLEVPDYNETITAGNLYERAQFHAEVNFFPGSTQKKEFLSTVADALFAKLPELKEGEGLKIVEAITTSIEEKDSLISLLNPASDHVFETLGWNGALADFPCPSSGNCHKDYAMVVDSNFGVNKANYFVKRDLEEVITFDKNLSVSHTLRLRYQNTSTSNAWPAGSYKNYQRLYLPLGSTISSIKLGDKLLSASDYTLSEEHGKAVVAYLLTVQTSSSLVVEVSYTTPQLPQENELLYTWYWQKQPGTSSNDNLTVYLNYPLYLKPQVVSPTAQVAPQQLKFDFQNDTDHRVTVKFAK